MNFLKNLFNSLFKTNDPMQEFDNNQTKVKDSLTNLIYQHSKMLDKQTILIDENELLAQDLEETVKENDDELSLQIIEKLEQNKEEIHFLSEQIQGLEENIIELKNTKKEIELSKGRYKDLLAINENKKNALNAKKEILAQINDLNSYKSSLNSESYLTQLKDQIHKTNAEITMLKDETVERDKIQQLRSNRVKKSHLEKLNQLKEKINDKEVIIVN